MTRWRWYHDVFADGQGAGGHGRNGTGFGTAGYEGDGFGSPSAFFESGDGHSNNGSLDAQEFFVFLLGGKLVGHDD